MKAGATFQNNSWKTLTHNGILLAPPPPMFPPSARPRRGGVSIEMGPIAEEMLRAYLRLRNSTHFKSERLQRNFFADLNRTSRVRLTSLNELDLKHTIAHIERENILHKERAREKRELLKKQREALRERYGYVMMDNRRMEITAFTMGPSRLFIGHGDHPLRGRFVPRIEANDVTLNHSRHPPPPPPTYSPSPWASLLDVKPERKTKRDASKANVYSEDNAENASGDKRWGAVVQERRATWLASWSHPLQANKPQYIFPSMASGPRTARDRFKYELAVRLQRHLPRVRAAYEADLARTGKSDKDSRARQLATIVTLVDLHGLRIGHERHDNSIKKRGRTHTPRSESSPTFGAATLRRRHARVIDEEHVALDFAGKDSVQFRRTLRLPRAAVAVVRAALDAKSSSPESPLFPNVHNAKEVNQYLEGLMPDLTAKVFRTRAATEIVRAALQRFRAKDIKNTKNASEFKKSPTVDNKKSERDVINDVLNAWHDANEEVAKFCNHVSVDADGKPKLALGTSRANYIDPRVVFAHFLRHNTSFQRAYPKTLLARFEWALLEMKQIIETKKGE